MNKVEKKQLRRELIIASLTGILALLFFVAFHLKWFISLPLTVVVYIGLQFIYKQSKDQDELDVLLSEGRKRVSNIRHALAEMKSINLNQQTETKNIALSICNDIDDILNYVEKNPDKSYRIQSFITSILSNIEQMIQRYVSLVNRFNGESMSNEVSEIHTILTKMKNYIRKTKEKVLSDEIEDLQLSKTFLKEIMEMEDI